MSTLEDFTQLSYPHLRPSEHRESSWSQDPSNCPHGSAFVQHETTEVHPLRGPTNVYMNRYMSCFVIKNNHFLPHIVCTTLVF